MLLVPATLVEAVQRCCTEAYQILPYPPLPTGTSRPVFTIESGRLVPLGAAQPRQPGF